MEIPAGFFNVSFNKAMAFGYRTEDVDEFVTRALHITKAMQEENETLQQKLEVLASNLENYREEEDSLRSALIGAQKLGDSILKDSRQKAEKIILDAEARAGKITSEAEAAIDKQQYELEQVQAETAGFKEKLFSLYRTHLDIIKNIPSGYDGNTKPRAKTPPPSQPAATQPQPEEQTDETAVDTNHQAPADMPQGHGYDERSSAVYTEYADTEPEQYTVDNAESYTAEEPEQEQTMSESEPQREEQEDDFDSPFIVEDPDSDKQFTTYQPYAEQYDEPVDTVQTAVTRALPPKEDDTAVYKAPLRRVEEPHPFTTPPMVQLEFDTGGYDDYDDDEFAAEKKLLREANLNRIPYLDDDDEDDFAVQLTSKRKPIVSPKFGELKFGEAFNLRED